MKNYRLVYSTDPEVNKKCPRCKELISECTCPKDEDMSNVKITPVLRIEKSGRHGKTVTVIDKLPLNESYLKDLTSELKKKCGSGGTYKTEAGKGSIEIQGEKRELIRAYFEKQGIKVKG
ncbi:MAG: hypothetical protein HF314_09225 [Ignavibacteria bacterium]|jgi:translation initiation factor 1|nr:hypothetical protein [Ignavibacteria bacterium]MCU7503243.1 hypothetical protein [Ignavibacteria bacterium]MCU7517312.1 hypothetical protein [Ignavibacteria bacterium]